MSIMEDRPRISRLPDPADIVRIEMVDPPLERERGEGLYVLNHKKSETFMDFVDLLKELEILQPGRSELIADRLYNFRIVYINLKTKEVLT